MLKIQYRPIIALLSLFLAIAGATPTMAQLTRGFVSGTINDPTNAILPSVQVVLTNLGTGISRETVTNEIGFYRFAGLEPGQYKVDFSLPGFATITVQNVIVSTAQEVTLNQTMTLGPRETNVTVTSTPGIDLAKTTATLQRTFNETVVNELPTTSANRDLTRLALLAPTVIRAPASSELSANGQRARNNNFTIDGIDNNDFSTSLNSSRLLAEAVQEVQVQTTAYSAEFGRNTGAQISAVTRGGTNAYHGEAWENYRGNWMEPLSIINKRAGINDTPWFVVHQFGGDAAGPIVKNRTFFFGLAEWNKRREAPDARNDTSPATIPTPAGYAALQNLPLRPATTTSQGVVIPAQSSASRQAMLSALSFLPDVYPQIVNFESRRPVSINGVPVEVGLARIPLANPKDFFYNVGRLDHKFTDRDNVTYRYHLDKRNEPNLNDNTQFGTRFAAAQTILRQNHALSYTRILSPRFLNEARVAYVRSNQDFPENDPTSSTVLITSFFNIGGLSAFPQGRLDHTWQFQNVSTYTTGKHSVKFGADLRKYGLFNNSAVDSKGTWTFGTLEDFINNNPTSLRQSVNTASFNVNQWNQAYFVQDDFKFKRNLTLNLGLRYEYSQVPLGFFGATDPVIRAAGVPGPVRPDKNNWAPRIGFAYSPTERTAIRGGFGMAYDVLFYNLLILESNNYPRIVNSDTTPPAVIDLFPKLAPKIGVLPPFDPLGTFVNSPEDLQNPTTNFWSLSVQREFGSANTLEVGYSGNRSYHQIRQSNANPSILTAEQAAQVVATKNANIIPGTQARRLNPSWGTRNILESTAKAEYHAGFIKFDKRMSHGLLVGANYTYSGNWSDNDEALGIADISNSTPQVPQDFFNYRAEWGRSIFDRPHRFVAHYSYDVPWFTSGWASGALSKIFSGWQVAGWTDAQSGQPFTIRTGVDSAGTSNGASGRPNVNPAGVFKENYDATGTFHEKSGGGLRTFYIPINGTGIVVAPLTSSGSSVLANSMANGGNLGRNTFRGPSFQNWNLNLTRKIALHENWNLQLRADFINLFNHTNWQNPVATMSSPTFGQNTAVPLTDPRFINFTAKLSF